MTILMTTNKPDMIYKPILQNKAISTKIPIDIADKENIIEILKHYTKNNQSSIDYNVIADKILEKASQTGRAFSNTDIKNIALCKVTSFNIDTNKQQIISQEKMLETIEKTVPEIRKEELEYYNKIKNKV